MTEPRPWLSHVNIKGFRSLADVSFGLRRLDVLIGPNGSGKSNLLQLLRMVAMVRTKSLGLFVARSCGGASTLFHTDGIRKAKTIECELQFEVEARGTSRYRATWQLAAGDRLVFVEEQIAFRKQGQAKWQTENLGEGHFESAVPFESQLKSTAKRRPGGLAAHINLCLKGLSFFHFHDTSVGAPLRSNARIADGTYLRSDGSNLAAYLYALQKSDEEEDQVVWRRIAALLQQAAPFVKHLAPTPVSDSGTPQVRESAAGGSVRLHWIDERDSRFDPEQFSDGTLRLIALITALTMPAHRRPRFVSIDEPELGLHPAALSLIVDLIRSGSAHTQVLLATQSPSLLDLFEPSDVVVCEREQGASTLRRLDRMELEQWLATYTLGQLFDKGVLGGRP